MKRERAKRKEWRSMPDRILLHVLRLAAESENLEPTAVVVNVTH